MSHIPDHDSADNKPERYLLLGDIGLHYPLASTLLRNFVRG